MAGSSRPLLNRLRSSTAGTSVMVAAAAALVAGSLADLRPALGQSKQFVTFPKRPGQSASQSRSNLFRKKPEDKKEPMLVRADEIDYDYVNERVAAIGNVQIYRGGSALEADRVIYDQKTKRLHAEGNVRLTEADGKVTHGDIIDLSDDFRDGFIDSLRLEGADETRMAATRADRTGENFTVFQNGVYTACEPCADDPKKPPKWQIKAARIIHDNGEHMIYFEDTTLEFFGVPIAWMPFFSAPDPSVKRKSGFLIPSYTTSSVYGFGFATPYYFALSPSYDATITPMITAKQGPLVIGEFRQRLLNGSYYIRASGIFQLDKQALINTPGYQDMRGNVTSAGQFALSDKWRWGWDANLVSDKTYLQDYGLFRSIRSNDLLTIVPDYALTQVYLQGRGERSAFDMRAMYFYGFTTVDDQKLVPVVHPVVDHDYTFDKPILGGELSLHSNLTSLSRDTAAFAPITQLASTGGFCGIASADPAIKTPANCLLNGIPGTYSRVSTQADWRRTFVDPFGQVFTPFVSVRADFADIDIKNQPGVSNYMTPGHSDIARVMPAVGVEYRYPFINVQPWGTQTITPIAQVILRPDETEIGKFPNEDAHSLVFDASNLFQVNKFSGWDRVEGGSRVNAGIQYTAQFNRGGYFNALFGQSYQIFGQNSYAIGGSTNTGISSGLDTTVSDYVASATLQPNAMFSFTSRFRFAESDFSLQRTELESTMSLNERLSGTLTYGNYAPQPALGFLDRREGVLATGTWKLDPTWRLLGGVRYDLKASQVSTTNIGVGYVDDCLILALNYITQYSYSGTTTYNRTLMVQMSLRTLGGGVVSGGLGLLDSGISSAIPGVR